MNKKIYFLFFTISLLLLCQPSIIWAKTAPSISLKDALHLAEKNSPFLSASRLRELAASKTITIARSTYYPKVDFDAIDSTGFPASNGQMGVGGLMDSPYRSGAAAGFVAQQTIWDFGRTSNAIRVAQDEMTLSRQNTRVSDYQIKLLALKVYYECSADRTQRDTWEQLGKESALITKEVKHFVRTGQRSVVDKYLSKAQTEQAYTAQAFFNTQLRQANHQLAVIMGVPDGKYSCPALPSRTISSLNAQRTMYSNSPLLDQALARMNVAQDQLKQEKANYFPKIVAEASIGEMQKTRLVNKEDYAVGVGVIFPIIDVHTIGKIQHAEAIASAKEQDIDAEKQYLNEINAQYDLIIKSSTVRLQHLHYELILSDKAFALAKQRYFDLQGVLIDLREAFRNLARTQTTITATYAELLQAKDEKYLVNGGMI